MSCYYIIKNPNGEDIKIPADFGTLSKDEAIQTLFDNIGASGTFNIVEHIWGEINGSLSKENIYGIVEGNVGDLNKIIRTVNEAIPQNGEYLGFEKALTKYLMDNKSKILEMKQAMSSVMTLDYHKDIVPSGLLNQTSIARQHELISADLADYKQAGIDASILVEMDIFMDALRQKDRKMYNSNVLLANSSLLGASASNVHNYTVYNEGNINSMFLGLFKRFGNGLKRSQLEEFFTHPNLPNGGANYFATVIENGVVMQSGFEKDLRSKLPEAAKRVKKAIELVSTHISPDGSLLNTLTNLFNFLDPGSDLEFRNNESERTKSFVKEERAFENAFKTDRYKRYLSTVESDYDKHYATQRSQRYNIYEFMQDNLITGQDLVYFPSEGVYVLLTEFNARQNGKVYVRGISKMGKNSRYVSEVFDSKNPLIYRTKETVDNFDASEKIEPITDRVEVVSPKGFDENLLRQLLVKGDVIMDEWVIEGFTATTILVRNINPKNTNYYNKRAETSYAQVTRFESSRLNADSGITDWSTLNGLQIVENDSITVGDKIKDPNDGNRIKTVLKSDGQFVWVETLGQIKSIAANTIESARLSSNDTSIADEYIDIEDQAGKVSKSSSLSSFTDKSLAKKGDYFRDSRGNISKIVDIKIGKIVTRDSETGKLSTGLLGNQIGTFYTKRDISNKFSPVSIRVNNFLVKPLLGEFDNASDYAKAIYVVPKGSDISGLYLYPNNYANIGEYKTSKEFDPDYDTDITEKMIELVAKKLDIDASKVDLQIAKEGENGYKNDLTAVNKVSKFTELPKDIKNALDPIQPGVFITIHDVASVNPNIYIVTAVSGDNVVIQTSKTNLKGDIITDQRVLSKEALLQGKENPRDYPAKDSLSELYIPSNQPNSVTVIQAIEQKRSYEEILERNSLNTLITNMRNLFKRINLEVVEDTNNDENFQKGQKAKITTGTDGKTKIVLNSAEGKYSDLVHENLHIYLTLLRYSNTEAYFTMVEEILRNDEDFIKKNGMDADVSVKEEWVVDKIVELSQGRNTFLYNNLKGFLHSMTDIITEYINPEYKFDLASVVHNPIEFLNKTMREFYGISKENSEHPFYNMGLLTAEPILRQWMARNDVKLKCI